MKKGTVMSIDKKWATVFTEDCQLIRLPLQPDMVVGREITLMTQKAQARNMPAIRRLKPALMAACFVLLLTVGWLFSQGLIFNPVYATVSIDVNPSLELDLNRQLKVMSVKAMNGEAERLVAGEDYKGLDVEEAIYRWIGKIQVGNLYPVKTMLVSAVIPDRAEALITRLIHLEENQTQSELQNMTVRFIYTHDLAVRKQASENGLSIGRQMLLNQAKMQSRDDTRESIARDPLDELIARLLKNKERDQTRLTEQATQSLSDPSSSGTEATTRVTSQSSSGSSSGTGSGPTTSPQSSSQYTNSSTQTSGTGTSSRATDPQTSGSTQASGTGTDSQTSNQQTSGSTQGTGSGSTGGSGKG